MDTLFRNLSSLLKELERFASNHVVVVEQALCFLDPGAYRFIQTCTFHADGIDRTDPGRVAFSNQKWRSVGADLGHAADKGEPTDGGIVVHGGQSTETGLVLDDHMTTEQNTIRHDDFISHDAVVGHMGTGENVATVSEARDAATLNSSTIDGAVLTEKIVRADLKPGFFALPLFILGVTADDGSCVNDVSFTHTGVLDHGGVVMNDAMVTDENLGANVCARPDLHTFTQFSTGIDNRSWVNQSKLPIEHPPA